MIREEKQRQLNAVLDELRSIDNRLAELNRDCEILNAWLAGYDAANAVAIEPEPASPTISGEEHVEHQVLEVLSTGRQLGLEQLRRSFGWSHAETDSAVAHLFAMQKITLGTQGYRLLMPGDKSFVGPADESPSRSNGGGLA